MIVMKENSKMVRVAVRNVMNLAKLVLLSLPNVVLAKMASSMFKAQMNVWFNVKKDTHREI